MSQSPPSDNLIVSLVPTDERERYVDLAEKFKETFSEAPSFFARAPGRVNLIGEHIDYCGYGVLPMALQNDIVIATSTNDSAKLVLHNVSPQFSSFECDINKITIEKNNPSWYKYFLCGIKGVLEHANLPSGVGMNCILDGKVPQSAGLSSSSALVCCSATATMHANGWNFTKTEMADVCAASERYIGTEGGGMDQAISFLAQAGMAKQIEFNPLRLSDVTLPPDASFVITNSRVQMNKAASAQFNIRVVETRLGTQIMAKSAGLDWREVRKPGDLQKALGVELYEMVVMVEDSLHAQAYSKSEVCEILGVTPDELTTTSLSENTLHVDEFHLHDRLLHVFTEASRVYEFQSVCEDQPDDALDQLGELMNQSHMSCSRLYQCSCTELDQLVTLCRQYGAKGSRMTGAGWGGCVVSLVHVDQSAAFINKIVEGEYYRTPGRDVDVGGAVFISQPGSGVTVYTLE